MTSAYEKILVKILDFKLKNKGHVPTCIKISNHFFDKLMLSRNALQVLSINLENGKPKNIFGIDYVVSDSIDEIELF